MATAETTKKDGSKDIHVRVVPILLRHLRRYDLANVLLPSGCVLDAACGSGYGKNVIGLHRDYSGVDLSTSAVEFATANYGEYFSVQDVTALQFEPSTFDGVATFETLEHIPRPDLALAEFKRVVRPGGAIVGSVPLRHPDLVHHFKVYVFSEVKSMLEQSGFRIDVLYIQRDVTFDVLNADLPDSSNGTLIFRGIA